MRNLALVIIVMFLCMVVSCEEKKQLTTENLTVLSVQIMNNFYDKLRGGDINLEDTSEKLCKAMGLKESVIEIESGDKVKKWEYTFSDSLTFTFIVVDRVLTGKDVLGGNITIVNPTHRGRVIPVQLYNSIMEKAVETGLLYASDLTMVGCPGYIVQKEYMNGIDIYMYPKSHYWEKNKK